MKPFQYRFHWGKETAADEPYIKQQYERWEDFLDVRNEWDPKGVFLNRYLEPFFGSSNGTRTVRHDPQLLA